MRWNRNHHIYARGASFAYAGAKHLRRRMTFCFAFCPAASLSFQTALALRTFAVCSNREDNGPSIRRTCR